MGSNVDFTMIDRAIDATLKAIEEGREQIFTIAEEARQEYEKLKEELGKVQKRVEESVAKVDQLEAAYFQARYRLMEVSRDFGLHSEERIKTVYQEAHRLQTELIVEREREGQWRVRRDELQRRLKSLEQLIQRAENLVSQLSLAYRYLSGDLQNISTVLQSAEEKRFLGIQVIQAQEKERMRVAREIHDGPAQMMANVALRAEICERLLDRDLNRVRVELRELKEMVRTSLKEVRQIIFDLRPMSLDDLGLFPTLRNYIGHLQDRGKTEIHFKIFGKVRRFPSSFEVAVFRIVQEALNNALRHAEASEVMVKVELLSEGIRIHIRDNGKGFDVEQVMAKREDGHFGLLGIQERIQLLGGDMKIHSTPRKGTQLIFSLPIPKEGEVISNETSDKDPSGG